MTCIDLLHLCSNQICVDTLNILARNNDAYSRMLNSILEEIGKLERVFTTSCRSVKEFNTETAVRGISGTAIYHARIRVDKPVYRIGEKGHLAGFQSVLRCIFVFLFVRSLPIPTLLQPSPWIVQCFEQEIVAITAWLDWWASSEREPN